MVQPVALGGFLLANTPATMMLMGWTGAGGGVGNVNAGVGTYFYLGAICLYAGGIGEWILGNTFPSVVFFTFGGMGRAYSLAPFRADVARILGSLRCHGHTILWRCLVI